MKAQRIPTSPIGQKPKPEPKPEPKSRPCGKLTNLFAGKDEHEPLMAWAEVAKELHKREVYHSRDEPGSPSRVEVRGGVEVVVDNEPTKRESLYPGRGPLCPQACKNAHDTALLKVRKALVELGLEEIGIEDLLQHA